MNDRYYAGKDICEAITELFEHIGNLPAANVVEVVRCKDCKYWAYEKDLDTSVCVMHSISGWRRIMPETAYCSMGVRKEGEE